MAEKKMSEGQQVFAGVKKTIDDLRDHVGRFTHNEAVGRGWGHIHEEATKHITMAMQHLNHAQVARSRFQGHDSLPHLANAAAVIHHVNTQLNTHSTSPISIADTADLKARAGKLASQSGKVQ